LEHQLESDCCGMLANGIIRQVHSLDVVNVKVVPQEKVVPNYRVAKSESLLIAQLALFVVY
jgi:hypothetical protein